MSVKIKIGRHEYEITRADRFMDVGPYVRLLTQVSNRDGARVPVGALRMLERRFGRVGRWRVPGMPSAVVYAYDIPD